MMTRILKNKKFRFFTILFLCLTVCFGFGDLALAAEDIGWMKAIVNMVSNPFDTLFGGIAAGIAFVFIKFFGILISLVLWGVVHIAEYNSFTNEDSIVMGWKIVRDFCNMFFILVLLLIAFATILRQENYSIKRLLPKLIIMAVLINFSLTICGIIIDFSQVVMLTFIDAIGNSGGNYINHLGVQKYLNLTKDNIINNNDDFNLVSNLAGLALGVVFLAIATVVLMVLLGVLIARIVMLWIYIVLSPLAFLLSAFPGGQSYASRWWDEFTKNVIVGPVLAFFIWLSLISVDTIDKMGNIKGSFNPNSSDACFGPADILCPDEFLAFVVAIGMLMGGLTIAQSLGGAGGAAASKGLNAIHKGRALAWTATKVGSDYLNRKQALGIKVPFTGGKTFRGLDLNVGRQSQRLKASLERGRRDDMSKMQNIANERLQRGGLTGAIGGFTATGWGDHHLRGFLGKEGLRSAFGGGEERLKELRKREKEKKEQADRIVHRDDWGAVQEDLAKKHGIPDLEKRFNAGDIKRKEYDAALEKALDNFNKDIGKYKVLDDKKEVDKRKKALRDEAQVISQKAQKITVQDFEGQKERRIACSEQSSKIDSKNEDELVEQFKYAVSTNNTPLAEALAKAIANVGGMNGLLASYGYQAKAGLTEKEVEKMKDSGMSETEIKQKQGFNDFMRDVFKDKLKMGEQTMLSLQSDLGSIGENIGHEHLIKTVKINDSGKFEQSQHDEREELKLAEKLKREPEGVIRKNNRLEYGSENINKPGGNNFEWSDSGLAYFISNMSIVDKEVDAKRFNRSSAKAVTQEDAFAKLETKLKEAGVTHYTNKNGDNVEVDVFLKKLKQYGRECSEETAEKLLARND